MMEVSSTDKAMYVMTSNQNRSTTINDFDEGLQSSAMHLSSVDGKIFDKFLENYNQDASPEKSLYGQKNNSFAAELHH